jgi:hypothetical protein
MSGVPHQNRAGVCNDCVAGLRMPKDKNQLFKIAFTAALITLISEVAKRNDRAGALIATLPMIWLHLEKQPASTISNHAYYTFWYVLAGALLLTAVLRFFNIHLF